MLDKDQQAVTPQDPASFPQRLDRMGDRAEGPRCHGGIEAGIRKGQFLGRLLQDLD